MTSDSDSEYHYFSSYKSADSNKTIDVLLAQGPRQQKSNLKLFLTSYELVHWNVRADNETTLQAIRLVTIKAKFFIKLTLYCLIISLLEFST